MRETLLGKLVLVLSRATPEELAAIYRFATGEGLSRATLDAGCSMLDGGGQSGDGASGTARELRELAQVPEGVRVGGAAEGGVPASRRTYSGGRGGDWEVVFGGERAFHLRNTLGARYVDYLLHHPNGPISAFELEVIVLPEKGEARVRNSIQPESDARAWGEYQEALRRLRASKAGGGGGGGPGRAGAAGPGDG